MRTYYVDVGMKFSVPASNAQEAEDIVRTKFRLGRYEPDPKTEIRIYESEDGR